MTETTIDTGINFENSYAEQLEGFYVPLLGDKAPAPKLVQFNRSLAESFNINVNDLQTNQIAAVLSGGTLPLGAVPLAQAYAGHQFGHFSPQLGDGRALLIGEVIDNNGNRKDIHLKGSGQTPFSRNGDGKAVLGPVLREYLMGEAMHALNIPTTRALAVVTTGENVMRDRLLPGAVLSRVAASHLRVGTFQFFASRNETDKVKQLADYTIWRHYPELMETDNKYLNLLRAVIDRQAALVAKWMQVGFVHGVMNTDNVTISGETIDYGPCAFIDSYDPNAKFSSIDAQGRYAYGNQPAMAQWALARLAETLLPLLAPDTEKAIELATNEVNRFVKQYQNLWLNGMQMKLGLSSIEESDLELVLQLHNVMEEQNVDFTLMFRGLSDVIEGNVDVVHALFDVPEKFEQWHLLWSERFKRDPIPMNERINLMKKVNPLYIPRNHKVEEALQAAENELDFSLFEKLIKVLNDPFERHKGFDDYALPAPAGFGPYKTFCGT